jgi:hypothetical protein
VITGNGSTARRPPQDLTELAANLLGLAQGPEIGTVYRCHLLGCATTG